MLEPSFSPSTSTPFGSIRLKPGKPHIANALWLNWPSDQFGRIRLDRRHFFRVSLGAETPEVFRGALFDRSRAPSSRHGSRELIHEKSRRPIGHIADQEGPLCRRRQPYLAGRTQRLEKLGVRSHAGRQVASDGLGVGEAADARRSPRQAFSLRRVLKLDGIDPLAARRAGRSARRFRPFASSPRTGSPFRSRYGRTRNTASNGVTF